VAADGPGRPAGRGRIAVVDALRAFALAGILQVNIQSFVWGAGDPLGQIVAPPGAVDAAVHLLVGTFVSTKFLSIFAFLFGVGFASQWRSLRRRLSVADAGAAYQRRLAFLLALGLMHGALLYYGDILTAYALAGFVLLWHAQARPAALLASTRRWWLAFAILTAASTFVFEAMRLAIPPAADPALLPQESLERFAVYTQGSYAQQFAVRLGDFGSVLVSTLLLGLPQVVALFLLGALAGRLGWLRRPQRHRRLWQAAVWIGLAALPFAAAGAWLNFATLRDSPGDPSAVGYGLQNAGSLLACLYVAAFVSLQRRPPVAALVGWLAPAGRMPLTNYVAQSAAMGLLLSGWGLGLGAVLGRAELALLALAIAVAQIVASRAWIGRFGSGPLEALWHLATYR
jgi:uncharacterized protein